MVHARLARPRALLQGAGAEWFPAARAPLKTLREGELFVMDYQRKLKEQARKQKVAEKRDRKAQRRAQAKASSTSLGKPTTAGTVVADGR
jgi:hypothetical protein